MVGGRSKNYPAPLKCVDAGASRLPRWKFDDGMAEERRLFTALMFTPESTALRHLFGAERVRRKMLDVPDDTPKREIE